jgi:hypothetical protein
MRGPYEKRGHQGVFAASGTKVVRVEIAEADAPVAAGMRTPTIEPATIS